MKPNYKLPTSYVRYIRKVGDEDNMSLDYVIEEADSKWLKTNGTILGDKEVKKTLTPDVFESMINLMEHHTGLSKEVIPLDHVTKLINETYRWFHNITHKVVPLVYNYWLKKREAIRKPLNRKFWPQTPASDNNPHLTFRPRDKERYRLRKQQRKNDVNSFRKLQRLQKEFAKAQDLICLIMEREALNEAEVNIGEAIFHQTLLDLRNTYTPGSAQSERENAWKIAPFQEYKLKYEHLLKEDEPLRVHEPSLHLGAHMRLNTSLNSNMQRGSTTHASNMSRQRPTQAQMSARRKKEDAGYGMAGGAGGGGGGAAYSHAQQVAPVYQDPTRMLEENALKSMHASLPGPKTACRPEWPSFMSHLHVRDTPSVARSLNEYIAELEFMERLQQPHQLKAISGYYMNDDGDDGNKNGKNDDKHDGKEMEPVDTDLQACYMQIVEEAAYKPSTYRCRGRVGRGGRVVIDRFPVYHSDHIGVDHNNTDLVPRHKVLYPTNLIPAAKPFKQGEKGGNQKASTTTTTTTGNVTVKHGTLTASSSSASLKSIKVEGDVPHSVIAPVPTSLGSTGQTILAANTTQDAASSNKASSTAAVLPVNIAVAPKVPHLREYYLVPPTIPPERAIVTTTLMSRQQDYYAISDDEEESVILQGPVNNKRKWEPSPTSEPTLSPFANTTTVQTSTEDKIPQISPITVAMDMDDIYSLTFGTGSVKALPTQSQQARMKREPLQKFRVKC